MLDGNFVLMDIAAAQWAFDRLGGSIGVDVRLAEPTRLDEAERAIGARLPAGLAVQRPARRGQQVEKMLAAFHFNLTALSYVALLVGSVPRLQHGRGVGDRAARGDRRAPRAGHAARRVLALFLAEALRWRRSGAWRDPAGLGPCLAAVALTSTTVTTLYIGARGRRAGARLGRRRTGVWHWHCRWRFWRPRPPALEAARVSPLRRSVAAPTTQARRRVRWRWTVSLALLLSGRSGASRQAVPSAACRSSASAAVFIVFGLAAPGARGARRSWPRLTRGRSLRCSASRAGSRTRTSPARSRGSSSRSRRSP